MKKAMNTTAPASTKSNELNAVELELAQGGGEGGAAFGGSFGPGGGSFGGVKAKGT